VRFGEHAGGKRYNGDVRRVHRSVNKRPSVHRMVNTDAVNKPVNG